MSSDARRSWSHPTKNESDRDGLSPPSFLRSAIKLAPKMEARIARGICPLEQTVMNRFNSINALSFESAALTLVICLMWAGRRPSGFGAPFIAMQSIASRICLSVGSIDAFEFDGSSSIVSPLRCFCRRTVADSKSGAITFQSFISIGVAPRTSPASIRCRTLRSTRRSFDSEVRWSEIATVVGDVSEVN